MRTIAPLVLRLVVGGLLVLPATARAEGRLLSVSDAVRIAIESSPRALASEARARAGHETADSSRGRMLPSLRVSDEYQHYDKEFALGFGGTNFLIRDADTNTFTASAQQPLLGLLRASQEHSADATSADAGEAKARAERSAIKHAVEVGYLRLFEAKALEDVARASQGELAEESNVAEAQMKAGVLTRADLLRIKVAQANARQQEILAHAQEETARADLLGTLGMPLDDRTVDFAEPRELLERADAPHPSTGDANRIALARRPELEHLRLTAVAADHEHSARFYGLLPEVNAEAAYIHMDGQAFVPKNSAFVGIKAEWPIFEWGATYYAQRAAAARADAARYDLEAEQRDVGVEVSTHLAQADASKAAVDVARETIESAQEAYRVTEALVKAGSATTTDLLDAEAALTQARSNLARAQYEQAMARVALDHSLGD